MLVAILSQWRAVVYGLLAAGLIVLGFTVADWRGRARDADRLEKERDAAIALERGAEASRKLADEVRVQVSAELEAERAKTHETIVEVIKNVPHYIDRSDCSLSIDGVRALNKARGVEALPDTGRGIAGEGAAGSADLGNVAPFVR